MNKTIIIIIILDLILFFLAFYYLKKDKRKGDAKRLVKKLKTESSVNRKNHSPLKKEQLSGYAEEIIAGIFDLSTLQTSLLSAGFSILPARFVLISAGTSGIFLILSFLLTLNSLFVIICCALGAGGPFIWLHIKKHQRETLLVQQMPDALDMIVRSLKVGHSVDGSLKDAGRSFPAPLGTEIALIYEEIAIGLPFKNALKNLENRFPKVSDIQIFCAAFILQRETGGNLSKILSGLSITIRERFQLERQVKAYTSEGRTSALVIGILPPAFAVITWFLNPDYIKMLLTHPLGQKFLLAALFFEVSGFIIMRMMTRLDA